MIQAQDLLVLFVHFCDTGRQSPHADPGLFFFLCGGGGVGGGGVPGNNPDNFLVLNFNNLREEVPGSVMPP